MFKPYRLVVVALSRLCLSHITHLRCPERAADRLNPLIGLRSFQPKCTEISTTAHVDLTGTDSADSIPKSAPWPLPHRLAAILSITLHYRQLRARPIPAVQASTTNSRKLPVCQSGSRVSNGVDFCPTAFKKLSWKADLFVSRKFAKTSGSAR